MDEKETTELEKNSANTQHYIWTKKKREKEKKTYVVIFVVVVVVKSGEKKANVVVCCGRHWQWERMLVQAINIILL